MTTLERAKKISYAHINLLNAALGFAAHGRSAEGAIQIFRAENLAEAAVRFTQAIEAAARGERRRKR